MQSEDITLLKFVIAFDKDGTRYYNWKAPIMEDFGTDSMVDLMNLIACVEVVKSRLIHMAEVGSQMQRKELEERD